MISRFSQKVFVLFIALAFVFVSALSAQNVRVGEDNEVTFEMPVKVGQSILQPGTYRFEHVVESDHHVFVLTPTSTSKDSHEVRVQCKLDPVGAPSKYTVLHFAPGKRYKTLHYILVAGESARHTF